MTSWFCFCFVLFFFAGIGKTTVLRAITEVCGVLFPSVVAIFTSCLDLNEEHPLGKWALYRTICRNLQARGHIQFDDAELEDDHSQVLFAKQKG